MKPATRYRITQGGRESCVDDCSESRLSALEEYALATGKSVKVERVTTRLLDDVPIGLGKIHSETELILELEQ